MKRIRIAIQKNGRLQEDSLSYLKKCGLKWNKMNNGEMIIPCTNKNIDLLFVRHGDIPEYVKWGSADLGIVGENSLYERKDTYVVRKRLGFGRCKLVIAVPNDSPILNITQLEHERIATSYPRTLTVFLKRKNIQASPISIHGSVEIAPSLGLADAICDITQSGNTLESNNLRSITTILTSEAVIISNDSADLSWLV